MQRRVAMFPAHSKAIRRSVPTSMRQITRAREIGVVLTRPMSGARVRRRPSPPTASQILQGGRTMRRPALKARVSPTEA